MNKVSGWVLRDHAELLAAFHGLDLVDPGIVDTTEWHSPLSSTQSWMYGAVALAP